MMNAHLYLKDLKRNRKSIMIWGILLAAFILLGMSFFPVLMQGEAFQQLKDFFENPFMKGWMKALDTTPEIMSNVLGFYATRNAFFLVFMGSVFSILLGGRIVSQEEYEKTAEFLLTRPVTRSEVMWSKLAVLFTGTTIIAVIILVSGYVSLILFKGDSSFKLTAFLVHSFYSFLMMHLFGAVGLFLSLMIRRGRPISNIAVGIVAGTFFVDMISKFTESANWIGYASPFKFMDTAVMRPDYGVAWWRLLYFVGITMTLWVLSFLIYRKKDILI